LENAFYSKKVTFPSSLLDGGTGEDGSGESDYEPFENMDWESEYEARKIRLRQLCETEEFKPDLSVQDSWRNGSSPDVRFVVDENNKVLYCELPKVGCTNWKRTMLQLIQPKTFGKLAFDDIKGPHGHYGEEGYKYITEWPAEERVKMVDTFYKFIFVRHPLERILSAYRDKVQYDFLRNLPFQNPGKVKDHDADEFMDLDKEGFHAFVKYLTKRVDLAAGGSRIRHWKRYVDLCGICSFDWDFVGKLETVNEDSQFVLEGECLPKARSPKNLKT